MRKIYLALTTFFVMLLITLQMPAQNWLEINKNNPNDFDNVASFGRSIDIFEDYAVVGAPGYDGAAYIFEKTTDDTWIKKHKFTPSGEYSLSLFGSSVSIYGDYAVVGCPNASYDENGLNPMEDAGASYVLKKNTDGSWELTQKLLASDRARRNRFGVSVAIHGDYLVIGSDLEGVMMNQPGAAYIFEKNNEDNWIEKQKLIASDRKDFDLFGQNVDIYENHVIVGARSDDEDANNANTKYYSGSVYIFEKDNHGIWGNQQKLVALDRAEGDHFGQDLAIYGDYAVIGAMQEDEDATFGNTISNAGSCYIFKKDVNGNWGQYQKIVASHRSINAFFGKSIAMDENVIIVGTSLESGDEDNSNTLQNAGAIYVFNKNTSNQWIQTQKIVASDRLEGDGFGSSVAIDQSNLIVGAPNVDLVNPNDDSTVKNIGAFYMFKQDSELSTKRNKKFSTFFATPNPTKELVKISSKKTVSQIKLYSNLGQLIMVSFNSNELNISKLNSGLYLLKVEALDGTSETLKILKQD